MRIRIYGFLLVLLAFFFTKTGLAKELPDVMLKRVTSELLVSLKEHDEELRQKPAMIYPLIDKILVPHVDWQEMSQWVIGRHLWQEASSDQRQKFSTEFKDLLIRTYASTLRAYNNQTIVYMPIRGGVGEKSRVLVASRIQEPGREPIRVTYRLVDKGDTWKVYDISIEGVSLLKGFQSQFASDLQQEGLDALILRLHQHNEKPLI